MAMRIAVLEPAICIEIDVEVPVRIFGCISSLRVYPGGFDQVARTRLELPSKSGCWYFLISVC